MTWEEKRDEFEGNYGTVYNDITLVLMEDPENIKGVTTVSCQAVDLTEEPDDDGWVSTWSVEWEPIGWDEDGEPEYDWEHPDCVTRSAFLYNYITDEWN